MFLGLGGAEEKAEGIFIHINVLQIWCHSILLFLWGEQCLVRESAGSGLADLGWVHSCTCVRLTGLLEFGWSRMAPIWRSCLFRMASYISSASW